MEQLNNQLQLFNHDEFGLVRCVEVNGKPHAVANDVLKALGYSEGGWRTTLSRKCKGVTKCNGLKVNGIEVNLIPEGDIYRLIVGSSLPSAEKFESWVFDIVLPTIRQTGGFVSNADMMVNTYFGALDDNYKGLVKGLFLNIENQQVQIAERDKTIKNLSPLAELAKKRIDKTGTVSLTDLTKTYSLKKGQISCWAKGQGYIHKSITEINNLGEEYFKIVDVNGFKGIGILEEGIKLIDENIEEIRQSPTKFKKVIEKSTN